MSGFMCVGQRVRGSIHWRIVAIGVSGVLLVTHSLRAELPSPTKAIPKKAAPEAGDVRDGELLANTEQQNRLVSELIRATVEAELRDARSFTASNPAVVQQNLKLMMERVVRAPELKADVRAQLRSQLEIVLRESVRSGVSRDVLNQQLQQAKAAGQDQQRVFDGLARKQEKTKQLMDRFNALMTEGRYAAADSIGSREMQDVAPNTPITAAANLLAHETGAYMANRAQRGTRQKAVVETLDTVELALTPFPDDQPVVYQDATAWEDLGFRRKKFKDATDLKKLGPAEAKIRVQLSEPTTMDFIETPLRDAIDFLKDLHHIEIQLDVKALETAGIDLETPVTRNLKGISLRSGLRVLLRQMELTYIVKDEVVLITTTDQASTEIFTRAYPVDDLVIPVRSMGTGAIGGGTRPGSIGPGTNPAPGGPGMGPGNPMQQPGFFNVPSQRSL